MKGDLQRYAHFSVLPAGFELGWFVWSIRNSLPLFIFMHFIFTSQRAHTHSGFSWLCWL